MNKKFFIALFSVIQQKCQPKWGKREPIPKRAPPILMAVLAATVPLLAGRLPYMAHDRGAGVFDMTDAKRYETDRYLVYVDYSENRQGVLIVENKENGERIYLARDAPRSSYRIMDCIYGRGNYVYYIKMTANRSGAILYERFDRFLVQEIDLADFSERTVFCANLNGKNLPGNAFATDGKDVSPFASFFASVATGIREFFVDERYLYFISSTDIYRIDRMTGKSRTVKCRAVALGRCSQR